jgi:lipid-binding SYLF domain-containing protein
MTARCGTALLLAALFTAACVWQPVAYTPAQEKPVATATAAFRQEPRLQRYFDEAVAYAIFPLAGRAGLAFGGAYGSGRLIEGGQAVGLVRMLEFYAGPNAGAQAYRQILFFRDAQSLADFKRGKLEFTGQANATVVATGATATPAYNPRVALFTQVRGGLLLEASVGAKKFQYVPLVAAP